MHVSPFGKIASFPRSAVRGLGGFVLKIRLKSLRCLRCVNHCGGSANEYLIPNALFCIKLCIE
jgi:hypothetical protein